MSLSVWLPRLGIGIERMKPGHNGRLRDRFPQSDLSLSLSFTHGLAVLRSSSQASALRATATSTWEQPRTVVGASTCVEIMPRPPGQTHVVGRHGTMKAQRALSRWLAISPLAHVQSARPPAKAV